VGLGPGWPEQKVRPYLQNNLSKKTEGMAQAIELLPNLTCISEFKLQYHQKKKKGGREDINF
jgi:hypothetical protein